jgi:hypothetical protein
MPFENPLDTVWELYEATRDCLGIAQRSIEQDNLDLLVSTKRFSIIASKDEAANLISHCHRETDDFVIVSLWSLFERRVVEFLHTKGAVICNESPKSFANRYYEKLKTEIEYWKSTDSLDLLKENIDPHILGQAKNIKKYRDWIAHKNPRKTVSAVTPDFAFKILTRILEEMSKLEHPGELYVHDNN